MDHKNSINLSQEDVRLLTFVVDNYIGILKRSKTPNKYNLLESMEKFRAGLEGDRLLVDMGVCICIGVSTTLAKQNGTLSKQEVERLKEILKFLCHNAGISYADLNALMNGNKPFDTTPY